MTVAAARRKTLEDYLHFDKDVRVELFEGEFYMAPSPDYDHQRAVYNIAGALRTFVRMHKLGEVIGAPFDCVLSMENVVQPDVLFVSSENLSRIRERLEGSPDLAVEVLSSAHAERDRIVKRDLYSKYGVREYWIVDPEERTVEVYVSRQGSWILHGFFKEEERLTSSLLTGLELPVRNFFM